MSIDTPEEAQRLATDLGLTFPILSDPKMRVIDRYGMRGQGMNMADMGYVVIDRRGQVQAKRIDREFGDHTLDILTATAAAQKGG